jgi:hypothetical protein
VVLERRPAGGAERGQQAFLAMGAVSLLGLPLVARLTSPADETERARPVTQAA